MFPTGQFTIGADRRRDRGVAGHSRWTDADSPINPFLVELGTAGYYAPVAWLMLATSHGCGQDAANRQDGGETILSLP